MTDELRPIACPETPIVMRTLGDGQMELAIFLPGSGYPGMFVPVIKALHDKDANSLGAAVEELVRKVYEKKWPEPYNWSA